MEDSTKIKLKYTTKREEKQEKATHVKIKELLSVESKTRGADKMKLHFDEIDDKICFKINHNCFAN